MSVVPLNHLVVDGELLVEPKVCPRHIEKGIRFVWEIEDVRHCNCVAESVSTLSRGRD
jgi:hypothetical protein